MAFVSDFVKALNAAITPTIAYKVFCPERSAFPRVLVRLANRDRSQSFSSGDLARNDSIELTIQHTNYDLAEVEAERVGPLACGISGTVGTNTVQAVRIQSESDDVTMLGDGSDSAVYERILTLSVFYV